MRLFIMCIDVIGIYICISMILCTIGFNLAGWPFIEALTIWLLDKTLAYSAKEYEDYKKIIVVLLVTLFGWMMLCYGIILYLERKEDRKLGELTNDILVCYKEYCDKRGLNFKIYCEIHDIDYVKYFDDDQYDSE